MHAQKTGLGPDSLLLGGKPGRMFSKAGGGWTPSSLGANLKGWWKADAGVKARTCRQFTAASSEYFSKAAFAAIQPGTADFSYEAWIYADTSAATQTVFGAGVGQGTNRGWSMYLTSANTLTAELFDTALSSFTSAAGAISDATWAHVVVTVDRDGNLTFYVNGSVSGTPASAAAASGSVSTDQNFFIGAYAPSFYWPGRMQCARVYVGTLLSGAQVTTLYNAGVALRYSELNGTLQAACAGAAWDLTEQSGTALDSSGGGNTLTDNNTVTDNDGITSGYAAAEGDRVWKWTDQSAAAIDLTQTTHANKFTYKTAILNGKAAVRKTAVSQILKNASSPNPSQPFSWWTVFDPNADGTALRIILCDGDATTEFMAVKPAAVNNTLGITAGTVISAAHTPGAAAQYAGIFNGASSDVQVNGTSIVTGNAGAGVATGLTLGANHLGNSSDFLGDWFEVIVVDKALTAGDVANLDAYALSRYGI